MGKLLTISVINKGTKEFNILWNQCKVRTKGGTWKLFSKGNTNSDKVPPGNHADTVFDPDFGVNVKRQYEIHITDGDSNKVFYHPGPDDFTNEQNPKIPVAW